MAIPNSIVLKIVNVIFWIVFFGLCIKTGALLTSFIVTLFINTEGAQDLYLGLNLLDLYAYDQMLYISTVSLIIVLTGLKAYIAYLVVKVFLKFNLSKPFDSALPNLFIKISHIAIGTGILAIIATGHSKWIMKKGIAVPIDWGSSEILFFAGVIYLLALVFKAGSDLQNENDLTV